MRQSISHKINDHLLKLPEIVCACNGPTRSIVLSYDINVYMYIPLSKTIHDLYPTVAEKIKFTKPFKFKPKLK